MIALKKVYEIKVCQSTHNRGSRRKERRVLKCLSGNSLVVQWLRLSACTAMGLGSILGQRTKIPQVAWCSQKKKKVFEEIMAENLPNLTKETDT